MKVRFVVLNVLVASNLGARSLGAQAAVEPGGNAGAVSCRREFQRAPGTYPAGVIRRLCPADVELLRGLLRQGTDTWGAVPRYYFGETYVHDLVDLIVYVDDEGTVRQALVQSGRILNQVLRGEKFLYVMVFAERQFAIDTTSGAYRLAVMRRDSALQHLRLRADSARAALAADRSESVKFAADSIRLVVALYADSMARLGSAPTDGVVRVTRTSTDYQVEAALTRLAFGLLSRVALTVSNTQPAAAPADSHATIAFESLGRGAGTSELFLARGRFKVDNNTWNRITIEAAPARLMPDVRAVVTNFANADRSRFAVGLGIGATFNAHTLKNDSVTGQEIRPNIYLLAHFYFTRPELPRRPTGFGPLVGTNLLDGALLNDIVFGLSVDRVSIGRLRTDAGLMAGVNFLTSQSVGKKNTRLGRFMIGFDLPL